MSQIVSEIESRWIDIFQDEYLGRKRKTFVYSIRDKSNAPLGQIKWYPAWRQYCFFPVWSVETIWNSECLDDVNTFVKQLNLAHKAGVRK